MTSSGGWGQSGRYDEYGEWTEPDSGPGWHEQAHDAPPGYAEPGYADSGPGYGDADGYGAPANRGELASYEPDGYPPPGRYSEPAEFAGSGYDPYQTDHYRAAPYGPESYGPGPYGPEPYDRGPYDRGPYEPGPYEPGPYEPGHYGPGGPEQPGYDSAPDQWADYGPPPGSFDGRQAEPNEPADARDWYDASPGGFAADRDAGSFGGYDSGPAPQRGALPTGMGGYAEWQDEPVRHWNGGGQAEARDWDEDDGLLDRRFGAGTEDIGRGRRGARVRAARRRRRTLRGRTAFVLAIVIAAGLLGVGGRFVYDQVQGFITHRYGDYSGAGYGTVKVFVGRGASLTQLAPELLNAGVIMATRPYISAANAATGTLQPGEYMLHYHMNSALVVKWLLSPAHRVKDQVTIIEGTRASDIALLLAKQSGYPATDFTYLIDHPAKLGLPSWAAGKTAEGFLFPDTYTLTPHETPLAILQQMVAEFKRFIAPIDTPSAAASVGTTPWHVLIVASMAQAEAGSPADFGKISRVAWNRLVKGMFLDFDSTVFYALHKYGTAATTAQQHFASPYNTYLHTGLPPGPIGNPGLKAVEAALHPPRGSWLYFITDIRHKPYKTYFTASFAQFNQWKQQFQG